MAYTDIEKQIAREIGWFYYYEEEKSKSGLLDETKRIVCNDIAKLGITNIKFDPVNNQITITLRQPGLLIGKKGENIEKLSKYLSKKIGINISIMIQENQLQDHLFSFLCQFSHQG